MAGFQVTAHGPFWGDHQGFSLRKSESAGYFRVSGDLGLTVGGLVYNNRVEVRQVIDE